MGRKSDFNSALPRSLKRFLILGGSDGQTRRMFLEAHAHHKAVRARMLTAKTNVDADSAEPTTVTV